jgi:hypothetical protein
MMDALLGWLLEREQLIRAQVTLVVACAPTREDRRVHLVVGAGGIAVTGDPL